MPKTYRHAANKRCPIVTNKALTLEADILPPYYNNKN
jgi:hypothetical protein